MFCSNCGKPLLAGATSCSSCGASVPGTSSFHTSTMGRRFANLLLDRVIATVIMFIVLAAILALGRTVALQDHIFSRVYTVLMPILMVLFFFFPNTLYYLIFESIWQRTPGKWATKTKVVKLDGTKPSFWRILGRSLARAIPFNALSFLFGKYPYGWHDMISGTMVVPASYSVAEAASVNPRDRQSSGKAAIIVGIIVGVLVILPIIGILASVVLASLNSARDKAVDVAILSDLSEMRTEAELYRANGSYEGLCQSPGAQRILARTTELAGNPLSPIACNDSAEEWAVSVPRRSEGYYCADSVNGTPVETTSSIADETSCAGDLGEESSVPSEGDTVASRSGVVTPAKSTTDVPTQGAKDSASIKTMTGPVAPGPRVHRSLYTMYYSPHDDFKVLLPKTPSYSAHEDLPSPTGGTYDYHQYDSSLDVDTEDIYYIERIIFSEPITDDPKTLLSNYIQQLIPRGGSLVQSSFGSHKNYKATEFLAFVDEEYLKGWVIIVDQSVYFVMVRGYKEDYDHLRYSSFVESFDVSR